ncbi:MAG: acetyltransferase [Oscillospiraceae bacterium]|nr:acetyltransferase [Oscillospiraceae bacterium]
MQKELVIIGAGGHGKVIADIAKWNGYQNIVFLDADKSKKNCGKYQVIGTENMLADLSGDIIVAIGNAADRRKIQERIDRSRIATLIHPDAFVADDVIIGKGTVIMAGAVINSGAIIGESCIINTCASVDHDCILSDYVHISAGAHIAGTVKIHSNTWIGVGVSVSNDIEIAGNCVVGAGAAVVQNIAIPGTYVGVPAVCVKQRKQSSLSDFQ